MDRREFLSIGALCTISGFGADKFTPLNEPGFRRFIKMVQARGMKLIVYVSACFIERGDPDLRPEWTRLPDLEIMHWHLAHCSPTSPGWREYSRPANPYRLRETTSSTA